MQILAKKGLGSVLLSKDGRVTANIHIIFQPNMKRIVKKMANWFKQKVWKFSNWNLSVVQKELFSPSPTPITAQKMKFSIKNFFSKCDQIRGKLRIWSHLLRKSLMENFIFCAVSLSSVNTFTLNDDYNLKLSDIQIWFLLSLFRYNYEVAASINRLKNKFL